MTTLPVSLSGRTRTVGNFSTSPQGSRLFDLRVLYKVFERVSGWQLEYTLCSLRQYVETKRLSCRCHAIEAETPTGTQTEFWITTSRWDWLRDFDDEVLGVLTMFVPVQRSEITVLGWHIPPILGLAVEQVTIPVSELEPEPPAPGSAPTVAVEPESWRIDALVASWAEIPCPESGAFTPLSDLRDESESEYEAYVDYSSEPSLSSSLFGPSPESSPLPALVSLPESPSLSSSLAALPTHKSLSHGWLGSLLESDWGLEAGLDHAVSFDSSLSPSLALPYPTWN